ncbi:MAG: PAS domain-containing protein, partial [Sinobacteraceae bacterium]|nr:PAS domain-containing protein [Nevskiaceae bacterium]
MHADPTYADELGVWSALVETIPTAVAMLDRELRYLVVSERWRQDYGLGRQSLIGRRHYEVFPDIPQRWKEIHACALRGQSSRSEEDLFQRADGSEVWLRWHVIPWRDASGQVGGILIQSEDVTEPKRIESRLAGYHELQVIADVAPVAIAYCDRQQRYRFVNRRFAERFAMNVDDIIGRTIPEIVGETAYRSFAEYVERALGGEAVDFELEIPYSGGSRQMRCSYMPHFDDAGRAVAFVAVIEDVTDRVRAKAAYEQARERLLFAVDAAEIGTFYCPMPMGAIEWNETCKSHFWLPPDAQVNFDLFYARLHAEDRERTREAVNRAVYE